MSSPQPRHGTEQPIQWQDRLPFVLDCTGKSAELIHEHQRHLIVPVRTNIFAQASQPTALHLLLEGTVNIIGSQGRREAQLGEITPGMLCDIAACILAAPHNYTARSATECEFSVLPIEIWQSLMKEDPSVSAKVLSQLCTDVNGVYRQIGSQ